MGSVVDKIFGGTDKSAQREQIAANRRATDLIGQATRQARGDVLALAPASFENRNLGFQGALDVFGQTLPQQFGTFQQGNMQAQGALLAGLPQFQNAILGLPADLSGFQPQRIDVDTSFAQQQLPEFVQPDLQQPGVQPQQFDLSRLLAGRVGQ